MNASVVMYPFCTTAYQVPAGPSFVWAAIKINGYQYIVRMYGGSSVPLPVSSHVLII